VQEARGLQGDALGAWLRQHGLHEADLASWRQQADPLRQGELSPDRGSSSYPELMI
jgi:hypothetical protein